MSSNPDICEDRYTQGRPIVSAKIVVVNPMTLRQTTIQKDLWIDTGFDGGIHVAQSHEADIRMIGVDLMSGTVGVAGGKTESSRRCLAYLQQIGDYELPVPGIEAELIFHGSARHGLLGLDILKNWTVRFDGPNELFKITSGSAPPKK